VNKEAYLGNGSWNVDNTIIKCSSSFAHKNMVEATLKRNHMLIDTLDKMHDPTIVMEEKKFKSKRKKCQMHKTNIEK